MINHSPWLALFSRRRKCRRCCAFLESDMVLVVQVRSSVMCTPRNLVLLTLSTVELSMVSGGWSVEFLLLKSITTSFVFSTFNKCSLHLQYHDWGETLEQGTDPPTAPRAPQYGCPLLQVCVHCCECALGWVKCRGQIPSMGHHTWPHTTSLSLSPLGTDC